jgi:uncharacterized protein YdhG (YjbR/CyaY superfamily)
LRHARATKSKGQGKPATTAQYLAALSPEKRAALERLRRTIRSVIPRAEECISYGLPAFRLDGKVLVWIGAGANHLAFYPGGAVEAFKSDLVGYKTSKGTIRFQPDHPLPATLVRKLIKARISRVAARSPKNKK